MSVATLFEIGDINIANKGVSQEEVLQQIALQDKLKEAEERREAEAFKRKLVQLIGGTIGFTLFIIIIYLIVKKIKSRERK